MTAAAVNPAAEPSVHVFGRLVRGLSEKDARSELVTVGDQMAAAFPQTHGNTRPQVVSYTRVMAYRKVLDRKQNKETDLKAAYFEDVCWNDDESDARGAASSKMEIMA